MRETIITTAEANSIKLILFLLIIIGLAGLLAAVIAKAEEPAKFSVELDIENNPVGIGQETIVEAVTPGKTVNSCSWKIIKGSGIIRGPDKDGPAQFFSSSQEGEVMIKVTCKLNEQEDSDTANITVK